MHTVYTVSANQAAELMYVKLIKNVRSHQWNGGISWKGSWCHGENKVWKVVAKVKWGRQRSFCNCICCVNFLNHFYCAVLSAHGLMPHCHMPCITLTAPWSNEAMTSAMYCVLPDRFWSFWIGSGQEANKLHVADLIQILRFKFLYPFLGPEKPSNQLKTLWCLEGWSKK